LSVFLGWSELANRKEDFWYRDISLGLKPFRCIGIAKGSDEVLEESRIGP